MIYISIECLSGSEVYFNVWKCFFGMASGFSASLPTFHYKMLLLTLMELRSRIVCLGDFFFFYLGTGLKFNSEELPFMTFISSYCLLSHIALI